MATLRSLKEEVLELTRNIDRLKNHVVTEIERKEMFRRAGKPMLNEIINTTPEDTGTLKNSIEYIVIDADHDALETCFKINKEIDSNIHTFLSNCIASPLRDESQFKRFNSDVVIALAITHHLLLGQNIHITNIVDTFYNFSSKYLLVEFMPLGLWNGDLNNSNIDIPDWYNLEWFINSFSKKFNILNIEKLEPNRILLICLKII
jgi:hypothetical protein